MLSRRFSSGSQKQQTDGRRERVKSRLLPMLLEGVTERDRLLILDVGSGSQSTLDFFSGCNARIHFTDLLSCPVCIQPGEDVDAERARQAFEVHLGLTDDVVFDICLFWDVFHRMDLATLQGLSRALAPHFSEHTLGYGFGTLHGQMLEHSRYGIGDSDHLMVRPTGLEPPFKAHSQQQLSEHFTSLNIQRSTLLQAGRLELLFARG